MTAAPPALCVRCARHAGQRLHWCIRLVFAGAAVRHCECTCRGR